MATPKHQGDGEGKNTGKGGRHSKERKETIERARKDSFEKGGFAAGNQDPRKRGLGRKDGQGEERNAWR